MTMIAYEALSAQELVQTYNSFAAQLGVPEVTSKFSSKALGIKRCQKLEEQLQTWEPQGNGQADEFEAQEEPAQEEPAQEEPAQEEPAQEEPAQEEPAQEEPAQEQEAKLKAPKVQSESPAERIQVDVSDPEAVFKAFKVREGTNKHRLLTAMIHAMGQSLSLSTMLKAAYGMEGVGDEGSLMMIVKGITVAITKNGLPFEVRKTRVVKVLHLALIHLEPEQESEA
jgi:flagellar biosynthesis GTPase FlhF